jgi:translation initiation factor IF-3
MEVSLINPTNDNQQRAIKNQEDLVNESIRFPEVLVIGPDGNTIGVKSRYDALQLARMQNLDLLCVAPMAKPPVCKILNYGKHRFEQQKKSKEIRKNQKVVEVKEVRFTPQTDDHDLETKVKAVKKWLADGNKVKVTVRYRGRQMSHVEVGEETLQKFLGMCGDECVIEKKPMLEGKMLMATIAPKTGKNS